jgi:hypothetical protein
MIYKILFIFVLTTLLVPAQSISLNTLSGKLIDAVTSEPLPGASVYLSGTTIGTTTDKNGIYQIQKIPSGRYQLVISMIGYNPIVQGINFSDNSNIKKDFSLEPKPIVMNTIQISEEHTSEWKDNLEIFKKYFLGQTDLSDECTIENKNEIVLTKDSNDVLHATCPAPIVVINRALGYNIECVLNQFYKDMKNNDLRILYVSKFTNLQHGNESGLKRWNEIRKEEYESSLRRFLQTLIRDKDTGDNYIVNEASKYIKPNVWYPPLKNLDSLFWQKHVIFNTSTQSYTLILPAVPFILINRTTRTKSFFYLPYEHAEIDPDGILFDPLSIQVMGDFANKGVANLLPRFYEDN